MTKKQSPRYVTFYLVMLILSTVGTALSVFSLFGLPATIAELHVSPLIGIAGIFNAVIFLVSVLALVLLWQKKRLGIQLKISTYIASIVVAIVSLFGAQEYIRIATEQAIAESGEEMTESMTQFIYTFTEVGVYVGFVIAIGISVTFLFLWRAAWKRQVEADS